MAPEKVLYRRLRKMGLGSHILTVSPPRRGHGGAHFIVHDGQAFLQELLKSDKFGLDRAVGRVFHRGSISLREVASRAGLHLSVGLDNSVDVHVDVVPPVVSTTPTGRCRYGPARVTAHLRHDVFPMILRRHIRRRSSRGTPRGTQRWVLPDAAGMAFHSASSFTWSPARYAVAIQGRSIRTPAFPEGAVSVTPVLVYIPARHNSFGRNASSCHPTCTSG